MNLIHVNTGVEISLDENKVSVLCVENPTLMSELLTDLWNQQQGKEGGWSLYEGGKETKLSSAAECIFNPYAIDSNSSTVLTKVYNSLASTTYEQMFIETGQVNGVITGYLESILEQQPFAMDYDDELDLKALLKGYHVRFPSDADTLEERLIDYVRVMCRILKKTVIVFLNLSQVIPANIMEQFLADLFYEKVYVLFIEGKDQSVYVRENRYIVDPDCCIINVNESEMNGINDGY